MNRSTPGLPVHHQLPEFNQTHVNRVSDAIQPSHPLSSPSPPAPNPSQHQSLFQWVNSSHEVAKVLEFQLQHQSFNEYSGLISFRIDWLDLPAVQGSLKSLLQHHSSKASYFWHLAFIIVQLSYPYMTTGKTIALTRQTFVGKVMSLLFKYAIQVGHIFSSKEQASFNFMAAVTICSDLGAPKIKSVLFPLFPHLFAMKWWDKMPWSSFSECWALSQLFCSPLSLSSRGSLVLFCFLP